MIVDSLILLLSLAILITIWTHEYLAPPNLPEDRSCGKGEGHGVHDSNDESLVDFLYIYFFKYISYFSSFDIITIFYVHLVFSMTREYIYIYKAECPLVSQLVRHNLFVNPLRKQLAYLMFVHPS